jgi:hypothetical protein
VKAIITISVDDYCFSRGLGEKPKKWKNLPLTNDIYVSKSTWTGAIGVLHVILGTKGGIILIEARVLGDQGALRIQE